MILLKNNFRIKEGILLMGWMLLLVILPTPCVFGKQNASGHHNIIIKGNANKIILGKEADKKFDKKKGSITLGTPLVTV